MPALLTKRLCSVPSPSVSSPTQNQFLPFTVTSNQRHSIRRIPEQPLPNAIASNQQKPIRSTPARLLPSAAASNQRQSMRSTPARHVVIDLVDEISVTIVPSTNTTDPSNQLKRKASVSLVDQCWSKERLVHESQQLMQLRVQATGAISEAARAHQAAVAASGRVVEQERVILAQVANKAKKVYREKEHALEKFILQYEKSKSDNLSACKQQKAAVNAEKQWQAKIKAGEQGGRDGIGLPSVTEIMMAL